MVAMQVETVGFCAIQLVAEDGAAQSFLVGTVHAQLMGAAGMGIEGYEARAPKVSNTSYSVTADFPF